MSIGGKILLAHLDTGATATLVALKHVLHLDLNEDEVFGVKIGDGRVKLTEGHVEGEVHVGARKKKAQFSAFDTDAFDAVVGTDFLTPMNG